MSFVLGATFSGTIFVNLAACHVKSVAANLSGRASGLFVTCVYGSATIAGYVIGWIVGLSGWTVAGNIQLVVLCLAGAVIALALRPRADVAASGQRAGDDADAPSSRSSGRDRQRLSRRLQLGPLCRTGQGLLRRGRHCGRGAGHAQFRHPDDGFFARKIRHRDDRGRQHRRLCRGTGRSADRATAGFHGGDGQRQRLSQPRRLARDFKTSRTSPARPSRSMR